MIQQFHDNATTMAVQRQCHDSVSISFSQQSVTDPASFTPGLPKCIQNHKIIEIYATDLWSLEARTVPRHGQCYDSTTTVPQQCHNSATTVPQQCHDNATTVPRQCYDSATTMLRQCHDNATTVPSGFGCMTK